MRLPALLPALLLGLAPLGLLAETLGPPLSGAEFDALTQGKTITYSESGSVYGIEEYRPGRKVVWAFEEGRCEEGSWFEDGSLICFDYHDPDVGLQCWSFHLRGGELVAFFEGRQENEPLVSLQESDARLNCPGPDVGV